MQKPLKILFVAAEAAPLAKVGGLGDVVGSLPPALKALPENPDVRITLPYYPNLTFTDNKPALVASFHVDRQAGQVQADVYEIEHNGIPIYLIAGPPVQAADQVYSGDNLLDGIKFCFFSLAALELVRILGWKPDIIHAHDWHAAPAVYKLRLIRNGQAFFQSTYSLLTIHNLPYLGHGTESVLQDFGLPRAHMSPLPDWAEGLPLPLGLLSADRITTVSPGYAREILSPDFSSGLEDFLSSRRADLKGILNGLDQTAWDPGSDPELVSNYSRDTLPKRGDNKISLLQELGLDQDPSVPLLAMINRMDHQKGVDLVLEALPQIADLAWQAVILGTGDPAIEAAAAELGQKFPRVQTILKFDSGLAHRIYSGADLILIPSRYEPCGLTQMIGMRYGCVPLARATGGLQDTILDYRQTDPKLSTGFLFAEASAPALADAIRQALEIYQDRRRWQGLQRRGMKKDFSWKRSAREYYQLYQGLYSTIKVPGNPVSSP